MKNGSGGMKIAPGGVMDSRDGEKYPPIQVIRNSPGGGGDDQFSGNGAPL